MNMAHIRTTVVGAVIGGAVVAGCMACASQAGPPPSTSAMKSSVVSTSTPPTPSVIELSPNDHGYVRVATKSGMTRCSLNLELVACHTAGDNWPRGSDGHPFHVASVTSDGQFQWVKADLGELEGIVTMEYQTYGAVGWTIVATADGTKFTNDRTGHGMTVSTEKVEPF
jgi:hypothetical protein